MSAKRITKKSTVAILMIHLVLGLYFEMMTSTVPMRTDWNFYDTSAHTVLYVRWINPLETRNVLVNADMTKQCWIYNGQENKNC